MQRVIGPFNHVDVYDAVGRAPAATKIHVCRKRDAGRSALVARVYPSQRSTSSLESTQRESNVNKFAKRVSAFEQRSRTDATLSEGGRGERPVGVSESGLLHSISLNSIQRNGAIAVMAISAVVARFFLQERKSVGRRSARTRTMEQ